MCAFYVFNLIQILSALSSNSQMWKQKVASGWPLQTHFSQLLLLWDWQPRPDQFFTGYQGPCLPASHLEQDELSLKCNYFAQIFSELFPFPLRLFLASLNIDIFKQSTDSLSEIKLHLTINDYFLCLNGCIRCKNNKRNR